MLQAWRICPICSKDTASRWRRQGTPRPSRGSSTPSQTTTATPPSARSANASSFSPCRFPGRSPRPRSPSTPRPDYDPPAACVHTTGSTSRPRTPARRRRCTSVVAVPTGRLRMLVIFTLLPPSPSITQMLLPSMLAGAEREDRETYTTHFFSIEVDGHTARRCFCCATIAGGEKHTFTGFFDCHLLQPIVNVLWQPGPAIQSQP